MKQQPQLILKKPNPPTSDAIDRAKFIDRTYVWKGAKSGQEDRTVLTGTLEKCPSCGRCKQKTYVSKKQDLGLILHM